MIITENWKISSGSIKGRATELAIRKWSISVTISEVEQIRMIIMSRVWSWQWGDYTGIETKVPQVESQWGQSVGWWKNLGWRECLWSKWQSLHICGGMTGRLVHDQTGREGIEGGKTKCHESLDCHESPKNGFYSWQWGKSSLETTMWEWGDPL